MTLEIPIPQLVFVLLNAAQVVYFVVADLKKKGRERLVGLCSTALVVIFLQVLFALGGWYDTTHFTP